MKEQQEAKRTRGRPRKDDKMSKNKGVKLPRSLETELKVYCLRHNLNQSQAMRLAIEQLVNQDEKEK